VVRINAVREFISVELREDRKVREASMKALLLFAVASFTIGAGAQTATGNSPSDVTAPGHTQASQSAETAASRSGVSEASQTAARSGKASASAAQASNVSAELTKKVDSKDAKVGDAVEGKTTSAARLADGTKLPKGTRLVGHVTEVSRKSDTQKTSRLAFGFDHAVMRDGSEMPIHATLMSLSAPAPAAGGDAGFADDAALGGGGAVGGRGGVRDGGSGLLVGGAGAVGGGGNLAGGAVNRLGATTSNAGAATTNTLGSTAHAGTQDLGATTNGAVASGANAERIPVGNLRGVSFSNATGASSSTTLESTGKNIHLDSGSRMTLSVAASN
jgi:hypothetical protein